MNSGEVQGEQLGARRRSIQRRRSASHLRACSAGGGHDGARAHHAAGQHHGRGDDARGQHGRGERRLAGGRAEAGSSERSTGGAQLVAVRHVSGQRQPCAPRLRPAAALAGVPLRAEELKGARRQRGRPQRRRRRVPRRKRVARRKAALRRRCRCRRRRRRRRRRWRRLFVVVVLWSALALRKAPRRAKRRRQRGRARRAQRAALAPLHPRAGAGRPKVRPALERAGCQCVSCTFEPMHKGCEPFWRAAGGAGGARRARAALKRAARDAGRNARPRAPAAARAGSTASTSESIAALCSPQCARRAAASAAQLRRCGAGRELRRSHAPRGANRPSCMTIVHCRARGGEAQQHLSELRLAGLRDRVRAGGVCGGRTPLAAQRRRRRLRREWKKRVEALAEAALHERQFLLAAPAHAAEKADRAAARAARRQDRAQEAALAAPPKRVPTRGNAPPNAPRVAQRRRRRRPHAPARASGRRAARACARQRSGSAADGHACGKAFCRQRDAWPSIAPAPRKAPHHGARTTAWRPRRRSCRTGPCASASCTARPCRGSLMPSTRHAKRHDAGAAHARGAEQALSAHGAAEGSTADAVPRRGRTAW
jgi:hypothetical protein